MFLSIQGVPGSKLSRFATASSKHYVFQGDTWMATEVDLAFVSNAELRAISEYYVTHFGYRNLNVWYHDMISLASRILSSATGEAVLQTPPVFAFC